MLWQLRSCILDLSSPQIMGILNVTPDSFSDGTQFVDPQAALDRALQMQEQGVNILDIGAESTRPGATPVDPQEEWRRLEKILPPIFEKIKIPISVDTRHDFVAEKALEMGAQIINDVSCASEVKLLEVVAKYEAAYVLMHSRGDPQTMNQLAKYEDVVSDVCRELEGALSRVQSTGISKARVILDPGFGFAKLAPDNYQILKELKLFHRFGLPLLIGVSRKRMLRECVGDDLESLDTATAAANFWAWQQGAQVFRVHDVRKTQLALQVGERILS